MSIFWNGSPINSLMLNGIETTGVYNGNIVWGNNTQQAKTLTLYHSEGGSLTADTLTGYPGDSVNLTTAYNTYWRFSGYDVTGDGTLNGNTYTFGTEDASICACYKPNAFTATGGWEKGSNITVTANKNNKSPKSTFRKYATYGSSTGEVPSNWHSTSNRWNPSNVSAYSITLKSKCSFELKTPGHTTLTAVAGATTLVNSSPNQTQSFNRTNGNAGTTNSNYSKTVTTTTQSTYSISGYVGATYNNGYGSTAVYVAKNTNGSWTATGYAP